MLDLDRLEGFDWDDGNSRKSADKHSVTQTEAEQVFVNRPLIVVEDSKHSATETRYQALGKTTGNRRLHVAFTLRRNEMLIRIISARDMNRKERAILVEPKMKKKLKPVPKFKNESEERKFWETHDTTPYVDWSKAQRVRFPNLKLSTKSISIRLPIGLLDEIKIAANKRDVPYQSLIKMWLAEKVG